LESHCSSQLSAEESSCGTYITCYTGCQCSDTQCIVGCLGKIDATCQQAAAPMQTCISQNCNSECNSAPPVDAGGGG
jgi:hypothetical protein